MRPRSEHKPSHIRPWLNNHGCSKEDRLGHCRHKGPHQTEKQSGNQPHEHRTCPWGRRTHHMSMCF